MAGRYSIIKNPMITLTYTDGIGKATKRFHNCWDLREWFLEHPNEAKAFLFTPNSKKKSVLDPLGECLMQFDGHDFLNNLNGYDKGRIMAQDARLIDKHANGYYITKEGKEVLRKIKDYLAVLKK